MTKQNSWVVVGQFGRVHGIKGLVKVHSFTQDPADIFDYADWHIHERGEWRRIELLEKETAHQQSLVKVKGYDTRELAMLLTLKEIGVSRSQLPALGDEEFYLFELVGMEVINERQERLGSVIQVLETGSNDVLVVEGNKRHLIPYLYGRVVKRVSRLEKLITVDWDDEFL